MNEVLSHVADSATSQLTAREHAAEKKLRDRPWEAAQLADPLLEQGGSGSPLTMFVAGARKELGLFPFLAAAWPVILKLV